MATTGFLVITQKVLKMNSKVNHLDQTLCHRIRCGFQGVFFVHKTIETSQIGCFSG